MIRDGAARIARTGQMHTGSPSSANCSILLSVKDADDCTTAGVAVVTSGTGCIGTVDFLLLDCSMLSLLLFAFLFLLLLRFRPEIA